MNKIWEWCGWRIYANSYGFLYYSPETVKAHPRSYKKYISDDPPELTLENLFKYAVPKLWEEGFWVQLLGDGILGWDARIHHLSSNDNYSIYQAKELKDALAQAIERVIDNRRE